MKFRTDANERRSHLDVYKVNNEKENINCHISPSYSIYMRPKSGKSEVFSLNSFWSVEEWNGLGSSQIDDQSFNSFKVRID